jgi:hypothetical protein
MSGLVFVLMPTFNVLQKKMGVPMLSAMTREKVASPMTDNGAPVEEASLPLTARGRTTALIALQTFEGSFPLSAKLAELLGTPLSELETKLGRSRTSIDGQLSEMTMKEVWATVLAVTMFEMKLASERDVWELVVAKARVWMKELKGLASEDVEKLEKLAVEVCGN